MAMFSLALEYILKNEGGLTDDPHDNGGITNFGISLRFLRGLPNPRLYGIHEDPPNADTIRHLTPAQAHDIYQGEFWNSAPFGKINDQDVCNFVFDMGINLGISPGVKCCQRAIWSVWGHYKALVDDGVLGADTLMWIERCKPDRLIPAMRSERAGYYRNIVQRLPDQDVHLAGWLARAYDANR